MRHLVLSLALIVSTLGLPTFALRASVGRPAIPAAQVHELPNVPLVSSGWQEKFWTHADGTKFHYLEWGTGTPVILIHGSGGTALNWMMNGLGASLAKTNRVLAIDMRGHGQTVGPDGKRQRRTPNMDLDVLAFMDAMKIQRAHIGGFSMGGSITSQLMARAPERFITAHFGGSGVREDENSEFAKLIPPDPTGTAPLDAEARKLYQARQASEAAKAGVANANDESQLSSQPVPAAVARPPLELKKIDFPDSRRRRRVRPAVHAHAPPVAGGAELPARDPEEPRAPVVLHGRHRAGAVSGCVDEFHRQQQPEAIGTRRTWPRLSASSRRCVVFERAPAVSSFRSPDSTPRTSCSRSFFHQELRELPALGLTLERHVFDYGLEVQEVPQGLSITKRQEPSA